jgi:hypothetical protein
MKIIESVELFEMAGICVIPLKENKAPMMPKGSPYLYEDVKEQKNWNRAQKIGMVCGKISGNLLTIDFDAHSQQPIKGIFRNYNDCQQMRFLIKSNKLGVYKTPSGGYHIYFLTEETHSGQTLAKWSDGEVMIETRGQGQYAASWPSDGYKRIAGADVFNLQQISNDELDFLLHRATTYSQIITPDSVLIGEDKPKKIWPEKFPDTPIGNFNNTGAELAKSTLIEHGWQLSGESFSGKGIEYWVRPNKNPDDGISATFGHCFNMFYVFTDSASPFEKKHGYSCFDVVRLLKFGGDFKQTLNFISPEKKEKAKKYPLEVELDRNGEAPERVKHLFPIDVFPDYFRDLILKLNETLNYHIDFTSVALLFTLATATGNKVKLRVKNGWETPLIFWFAALGEPGTIKSHPINTMLKPLKLSDKLRKQVYDKEYDEWEQNEKKGKAPIFKQSIVTDATLEALHHVHSVNKKAIGLHKDELIGFLNDMNKYRKGSDEQFWLESFNNTSYMVNRVTKRTLLIDNICINIIGTMQPDVLQKLASEQVSNGLLDRFLFTATEDKVYGITDKEISQQDFDDYTSIIKAMQDVFVYNEQEDTEVIELSAEAFKIYQEIDAEYVEVQNSDVETKSIKNYLSKMKTYIPRFALAIAILEHVSWGVPIDVTPETMKKAKLMADYFVNTARYIFQDVDRMSELKSVDSALKGKTKKERIIELYQKGAKQIDIAKLLNTYKSHVSKVINEFEARV